MKPWKLACANMASVMGETGGSSWTFHYKSQDNYEGTGPEGWTLEVGLRLLVLRYDGEVGPNSKKVWQFYEHNTIDALKERRSQIGNVIRNRRRQQEAWIPGPSEPGTEPLMPDAEEVVLAILKHPELAQKVAKGLTRSLFRSDMHYQKYLDPDALEWLAKEWERIGGQRGPLPPIVVQKPDPVQWAGRFAMTKTGTTWHLMKPGCSTPICGIQVDGSVNLKPKFRPAKEDVCRTCRGDAIKPRGMGWPF